MTGACEFMLIRPVHWIRCVEPARLDLVSSDASAVPSFAPLEQVFGFVRMSSVFYSPSELTEPWAIEIPAMDRCLWFHVVTEGACTLAIDDREAELSTGDVAVVPHGTGHSGWSPGERVPPRLVVDLPHEDLTEHYGRLRHGGGGRRTDLVCGGIRFDHPAARHLIGALPSLIVIRGGGLGRGSWTRPMLDLLADEIRHPRAGNAAIVGRLCDIIVIQALRSWIETDPAARSGWLGALHDPQLGEAIARIHAEPEQRWSVSSLASIAAMSRSAFSERFSEQVGEPPMTYVRRWRMYRAADLIESGQTSVAAAGRSVGYDSEAAFSRAYKRVIGVPPSLGFPEAAEPATA